MPDDVDDAYQVYVNGQLIGELGKFHKHGIMNSLNDQLSGRVGAVATCLILRITADGHVTLANAGHLAPYLNGVEIPMEGALPIGMLPQVDFSVLQFQFAPGDTLMLMSDGVAEA
jgi:serine phosphatase RsbU (regulator of sigma subunit)